MTIKRIFSPGPWQHEFSIVRNKDGVRLLGFFDGYENGHLVTQTPALYEAAIQIVKYTAGRLTQEIIPPQELLFPVAELALAILKAQSWELAAKKEIELFDGVAPGPFAKTPAQKIILRTAFLLAEAEKQEASR
jgi:hypothetical protein